MRRRGAAVRILGIGLAILGGVALAAFLWTRPWGGFAALPQPDSGPGIPLDPESPWPKFRADARQSGRARLAPRPDPEARPWTYPTGKGIFSSPVVDGKDRVYVGSADRRFYALDASGALRWSLETGEIIDSSALLDDQGRVFFGSGDGRVYALDREDGRVLWSFKAHSAEEATEAFGVETHNLAWFEGNIGLLADGRLLAPNDNYLVYLLDRETGAYSDRIEANEMVWSLPAYNARTGRLFFGSTFLALRNLFAADTGKSGRDGLAKAWTGGGLGSVAASPLLANDSPRGALFVGGFDGYLRAYRQDGGQRLWSFKARDHIYASPAQLSDGTIIQASADGTVYAVEPRSGRQIWAFDALEPIRSSPAVDAFDRIYLGSGEGRLFCIEPDGRLRWAWRLESGERNDLNSSPALGARGVYVAGESGGIHFLPYDYPLTEAGRADPRAYLGPAEDAPSDGAHLLAVGPFGEVRREAPESLASNAPIVLALVVREKGDTVQAALRRASLEVSVTVGSGGPSSAPAFESRVSADGRFLVLEPREYWTGPEGGSLKVGVRSSYATGLSRFGLKAFGGKVAGGVAAALSFFVPAREGAKGAAALESAPLRLELSRLAAPLPTLLPSWNQIGFDSLHYLAGEVGRLSSPEGVDRRLLWVIGGKPGPEGALPDPELGARFPLVMERSGDLVTLSNYRGFAIDFVGSWAMPFARYRIAGRSAPEGQAVPAALTAVALGDKIDFYGPFLKLLGMSEWKSGELLVSGGILVTERGPAPVAGGPGEPPRLRLSRPDKRRLRAELEGGALRRGEAVYGLLVLDAESGEALPLDYASATRAEFEESGLLRAFELPLDAKESGRALEVLLMRDTSVAARARLEP